MLEIFCPNCNELILDQPTCPSCGWRRPAADEGVGAELWRADLGARLIRPRCYPICAGDRYILGTEDGTLLALDAEGKLAWERSLQEGRMVHALASDGERVFVGCEDTQTIPTPGEALLALDPSTGEEMWQYETPAHSISTAAVSIGVVYFTSSEGTLYALDAATGEERWKVEHPIWGPTPPVVDEGIACAGGRGKILAAYDAVNGNPRWRHSGAGWFATPLIVDDGRLYALSWDDCLYVLEVTTGRTLWTLKGERSRGLTSPPMVSGGHVFVGSRVYRQIEGEQKRGYAMLALKAEDGAEIWRFHTEAHIFTPPNATEDRLFFGSRDGSFYAVDAASGEERWRVQTKSRTVTKPQVLGDKVIFGGRDGIIHAVRWRARPREEVLPPEVYERRGEYVKAAQAYALNGSFADAAAIFEDKLGQRREAAQLYERAKQPEKAAPLWEGLGDLKRARDLYREAGDKLGLAGALERTGELLQAARLHEEINNLEEAACLYERGGDRPKAARLYRQLGQLEKAQAIYHDLGWWEERVETLVERERFTDAARLLEQHGQLERAADLYVEAGQLEKALAIEVKRENWGIVADLASRVGDFEQEARAHEQQGRLLRAAEAYVQAAQKLIAAEPVNEERVAVLYERAAQLYRDVYEDERSLACHRMVRRYRHLPEVEVDVKAEGVFVEYQYNILKLEVTNRGYGVARDISVQLRGKFDIEGDCCVRGLPPKRSKSLGIPVRPQKDHYGPNVPLEIMVTYEDRYNKRYKVSYNTTIYVEQEGIIAGLGKSHTPMQITIQELYQHSARKVSGDELHTGAQKKEGGVVEIHRDGRSSIKLDGGETSEQIQTRRVGPEVRRCPICNLPIQDPEQRYCPDCGAPLDEETDR